MGPSISGLGSGWKATLTVVFFPENIAKRGHVLVLPTLNYFNFLSFSNLTKVTTAIVFSLYWTIFVQNLMQFG